MNIAGLQKVSLVDYPEKVACTIFFQGCNFNCEYCYNKSLISSQKNICLSEEYVLDFLRKRKNVLDAVCLCGGEPTMQDIEPFVREIKELGYLVKLDTNGSNPYLLEQLIDEKLIDYVAMDIKNSGISYSHTAGVDIDISVITKSMQIIINSDIDYEFRTTVVNGVFPDDLMDIADWLRTLSPDKKIKRYCLQKCKDVGNIYFDDDSDDTIELYAAILEKVCEEVIIKGDE